MRPARRLSVQVWRDGHVGARHPGDERHAMAVLPGERIVTAGDPTDTSEAVDARRRSSAASRWTTSVAIASLHC